jgi:predicted DCC family thiol-disulfide oxidoreductase YuxK
MFDLRVSLIIRTIVCLELFKILELIFVNYYRSYYNWSVILLTFLLCLFYLIYKNITFLIAISICNLYLIFLNNLVNQHFAFLTSLIIILSIGELYNYFSRREFFDIIFFLKLQLTILYLFAALWKSNFYFLTGTEIVTSSYELFLVPSSTDPSITFYSIIAVLATLSEYVLAIGIWLGSKIGDFIRLYGVFFHLGILFIIGEGIRNTFQLILFAFFCILLYPLSDTRNAYSFRRYSVYWDENCSFCLRTIKAALRLDNLSSLVVIGNSHLLKSKSHSRIYTQSNESIIVIDNLTGAIYTHSRAMFLIFTRNYFLSILFVFVDFPLVERLANLIYSKVALNRSCTLELK